MTVRIASVSLLAALLASVPAQAKTVVRSGVVAIELSDNGQITSVRWRQKNAVRPVSAETLLANTKQEGKTVCRRAANGAVEFERTLVSTEGRGRCRVVDRFSPGTGSIRWETEIHGDGTPWTTPIQTALRYPPSAGVRFWMAWADPEQRAPAMDRRTLTGWSDPLVTEPLQKRHLWYGAPYYTANEPRAAYNPMYGDLFAIPLATFLEPQADIGLTLALSPADDTLDLTLDTGGDGSLQFTRYHNRIDKDHVVKLRADLVAHEAGWQGGLRWMAAEYHGYFDPANPLAYELDGTSAYSASGTDFDAEKMRRMAFRTNWKASFDFPYMGLFLPPVKDGEKWARFPGDSAGRYKPSDVGKNGYTSIPEMAEYSAKMRAMGFYVLNYFNVTEFGAHVTWPAPPRQSPPGAELWKVCNDFLYSRFPGAIVISPKDQTNPLRFRDATPGHPYHTWGGAVVMDSGEPAYRDFLLNQARRHIQLLPESSGVCIDRLDWLRLYNENRDDGVSWVEGRPARSLAVSWKKLLTQLAPMMHDANKVIFVNNHDKRIDFLRSIDGIFDEFGYNGAALNSTALLTIRKAALGWVGSEEQIKPDPDGFMQRFLYMGVYPMAPFPGNDHSLRPSPWVDQLYLDYGPLMDAMRGRKWVLAPHAIEVAGNSAHANLFAVKDGYVIPVMLGGSQSKAEVTLRNLPEISELTASALHPASGEWQPVKAALDGKALALDVPLVRGCAMVRLTRRHGHGS